jgi:non-lysosomal glucosylceramidase
VLVKAQQSEQIEFSLVWHMPKIHFTGDDSKLYTRFYTRHFSDEDTDCALNIASYSFANEASWCETLRNWRRPIIENKKLPNYYKCCLFNELYFMSDGGTVWLLADDNKNELIRDFGRFAYLEGHEYRMYNTYDVHFYASFALLQLWPKLQLSLQYDFADTITTEIQTPTKFLFKGNTGIMKVKHCLPHDIGDPEDKPWDNLNAYVLHDTKDWKDLNLKFILTVYRDYVYVKDIDYLIHMWPKIKELMVTIQSQDHDDDGLIDGEGQPDQTYDAWSVTGASAYCGGLHVAALKCVIEIAKLLNDDPFAEKYSPILVKAKNSYDTKLWHDTYYKYDCSNSDYSDSIMADMCCGHWYLRCSGFKHEVFEKEKIKSCLETIFEYNVMKYGEGQRGAVNGMRPDGKVDITSMQSEEVWIGVTNSVASLMIFEVNITFFFRIFTK